ncbi:MAG: tRNA (N6-threonylcarbamoyladenosine(37)-N6)-methyltransferase TrmO [Eubacterium sp.]|nr:tRNA (N6-threonylcarbamoyladenosine(37)-N6)-methyltransferase TrmO [Eubacterium sp.]
MVIKPIAKLYNDFPTKFGIPRQSGRIAELKSKIIFEKEFRIEEAFRGLEQFSHLWLIWEFSESKKEGWSATVRPPRLGGNKRIGVFATRSPFRPNALGLSCVKLEAIEKDEKHGIVLIVSGADLMNGTPIYDIKPYIPYADCIEAAQGGFAEAHKDYKAEVEIPESLLKIIP